MPTIRWPAAMQEIFAIAKSRLSKGWMLCLCTAVPVYSTYKHFSSFPRALGQVLTCSRGLQERPGVRQGLVQACSRTTSPAPWHFQCCLGRDHFLLSRPCPVRGVHW